MCTRILNFVRPWIIFKCNSGFYSQKHKYTLQKAAVSKHPWKKVLIYLLKKVFEHGTEQDFDSVYGVCTL